jgi:hypothetical protein
MLAFFKEFGKFCCDGSRLISTICETIGNKPEGFFFGITIGTIETVLVWI